MWDKDQEKNTHLPQFKRQLCHVSCTACKAGTGLLQHYIRTGKCEKEIKQTILHFCVSLKIQDLKKYAVLSSAMHVAMSTIHIMNGKLWSLQFRSQHHKLWKYQNQEYQHLKYYTCPILTMIHIIVKEVLLIVQNRYAVVLPMDQRRQRNKLLENGVIIENKHIQT
ncbi:uncharacterized protein CBL_13817 [Carabus blaptoides fortunei]